MKLAGSLLLLATLGGVAASPAKRWAPPSPALKLNNYDQEIFDVAMQLGDWSWEPSTGYIQANDDGVSMSVSFSTFTRLTKIIGAYQYPFHRVVCTWPALPKPRRRRAKCHLGYQKHVSVPKGACSS